MIAETNNSRLEEVDSEVSYQAIAESACARLAENQPIRRNLPDEGRLRIDRQLPFLCVYRQPSDRDDVGTRELVTTEASYLFASGCPEHHDGLMSLCKQINMALQEHFGLFLVIEVWSQELDSLEASFEIVSPDLDSMPSTIQSFTAALEDIVISQRHAHVATRLTDQVAPPGLHPLEPICTDDGPGGCCVIGLAVNPIYRNPADSRLYPMVLQSLRRQLATALRKTIAQFTGIADDNSTEEHSEQEVDATAFHSLGPSSLVKAARLVDQQLCEVSESFDFLLQVTPTNAEEAWHQFSDGRFRSEPTLMYRPLPYRPSLLKRRLYEIEIERIEDPTLAHLFWEKQEELDRQLTALRDLNTPQFLYGSLQMYGEVDESLLQLAQEILASTDDNPTSVDEPKPTLKSVIARARDEIDHYHTEMPEFNAKVEVTDEIASGIMVSKDRLLISENLKLTESRLTPLLHHEIGTHLLTYFNGRCQPFRQLYAGLAEYEELQEGLAVLAEYLVGGLTVKRARTLAGRVVAARCMTEGADFCETFSCLHQDHAATPRQAFTTTMRLFRGGGFTKDIIYLRGLRDLLKYLAAGHDIEPLYVGKIGLQHVPYVQEMRRRKIIVPPCTLPRFFYDPQIRDRLDAVREMSVLQLLETD